MKYPEDDMAMLANWFQCYVSLNCSIDHIHVFVHM